MIITLRDIKEYLSKFPDELEVELDKNGWPDGDEIEIKNPTPIEVIDASGLFNKVNKYLIINN